MILDALENMRVRDCAQRQRNRHTILVSLKSMKVRDWLVLLALSAVVGVCGVLGVSYVAGSGWPMFGAVETALLCLLAFVTSAVIFFFADLLVTKMFHVKHVCRQKSPVQTVSASKMFHVKHPARQKSPVQTVSASKMFHVKRVRRQKSPVQTVSASKMFHVKRVRRQKSPVQTVSASKMFHVKHVRRQKSAVQTVSVPKMFHVKHFFAKASPRWNRKSILIFAGIMLVFWIPWLIANFPGGTYWDTYYQMYQVYPENHPIAIIPWEDIYDETLTDAWLVDHHPVLTTMIYGLFGWVSDQLTGNWMAGVFTFVCIQAILHVLVFTGACAYLRSRNCPLGLCFAAYAFFCIMPFVSTWAMCMVKDSMFGLFFLPYFMLLFEVVRTRGASFMRPRNVVLFALCGLMLCLTKKTGLFIVLPLTLVGMWVYRPSQIRLKFGVHSAGLRRASAYFRDRRTANSLSRDLRTANSLSHDRRTATPRPCDRRTPSPRPCNFRAPMLGFLAHGLTCVLVASIILPYVLFPLLNIIPGGKQEALGPVLQQTARYVVDYGDEVTEEERSAIDAVVDYDKLAEAYAFDFQDSVKYRYNLDATSEDLQRYFQVYLEMGLKHPDSYFAAIMSLAGFYVAPTAYANIRMVTVDTHMGDDDRYMLWNPDELDWLREGMESIYDAIGETPVLDVPLLLVLYDFWLPALLMYVAYRHRLKCGILFIPSLVLLAFCVVAPVYDARYVIPMFNIAPLIFCGIVVLLRQKEADERGSLRKVRVQKRVQLKCR